MELYPHHSLCKLRGSLVVTVYQFATSSDASAVKVRIDMRSTDIRTRLNQNTGSTLTYTFKDTEDAISQAKSGQWHWEDKYVLSPFKLA